MAGEMTGTRTAAGSTDDNAARSPTNVRFVVVTRNSARWFGPILDWYEALGIRLFVLLDASSSDGTEQLLKQRDVEYAKAHAEFPRVESFVRHIGDHVQAEWIARLDDDELPSRFLCAWIEARLDSLGRDVVGVQRRTIRLAADGRCEYSRHPLIVSRFGAVDAQWRLFRPERVHYCADIHTPGFHVPKGCPIAPLSAGIAHFEWLVRSADERRSKVEEYDRQLPGAGTRFRDVKVWEDGRLADHNFRRLDTNEFDAIAARLAATAPANP